MDDLKPCPFCGGRAVLYTSQVAEDAVVAFIVCESCGTETEKFEDTYAPKDDAVAAWNLRHNTAAEKEKEIERMRARMAGKSIPEILAAYAAHMGAEIRDKIEAVASKAIAQAVKDATAGTRGLSDYEEKEIVEEAIAEAAQRSTGKRNSGHLL